MILRVLSLIGVLTIIVGCGERCSVDPLQSGAVGDIADKGLIRFNISYVDPSGTRLSKPVVVDRMTAYVYESTGSEITHADLRHEGDRGKAEITVSVGDNRTVDLVAYEGTGVKWLGTNSDVDVAAGDTTSVEIAMQLTVPRLSDPGDTTTVGSYSLVWNRIAAATGYVLEEDTTTAFSKPRVAYAAPSGSDTLVSLSGIGAGTHFYRIKAAGVKTYGAGVWSSVESITVKQIPVKTDGEIQIDVPWPTDDTTAPREAMVLIPGGEFLMGDAFNEGQPDERPQHRVYLNAFYMDKHEVTNSQYKAFCDATGRSYPADPGFGVGYGSNYFLSSPQHPVVNVSWDDASAYALWVGKRLPTEAEWEKAARGGLEGKRYAWGDAITHDDANYSGTGGRDVWPYTSPAGSFSANGYGLYDVVGSVYEWCADWYDSGYYGSSPQSSPTGPTTGSDRAMRGGSWVGGANDVRVAYRASSYPSLKIFNVGFRCARSLTP